MTEDTSPENLRKFLESDDPALVRMGLSMAKGSGVPEDVLPAILKLYMWDDDKSVRTAARTMFFKHAPAEIQAKVKENWKPNYRTLNKVGDKFSEAIRSFIEAFESQDDFAEITLEPLIKALLGDNDWMIRRDHADALGAIGNARAVEPLIEALGENTNVCFVAARALGEIGDVRAVEPLIKALGDEDSYSRYPALYDRVRRDAVDALGKIGDEQAVEPLIKALGDHDIRQNAIVALGDIGDARAIEALVKLLSEESHRWAWRTRRYAVEALGKIGDSRTVEPLIKALGDKHGKIRTAATEALGEIGDSRAVEPITKALEDGSMEVRYCAAEALGKIGDARAVEPLIESFEDEDAFGGYARINAMEALGKIGDTRAVQPLIGVLSDGTWRAHVRKSAAGALGEIGDERAVEPLIGVLSDENEDVRNAAKKALKKLGHEVE